MRFLKKKLARAKQHLLTHPPEHLISNQPTKKEEDFIQTRERDFQAIKEEASLEISHSESSIIKIEAQKKSPKKSANYDSSKNIVKNYGRAICSFIISDLGVPYLTPILVRERVRLEELRTFISNEKERIDGISSFRRLLLPNESDEAQVIAFKNILKEMSVVFIKYFSVNWIFNGRLRDRLAHLKCRYKMLRRVRDPCHFTYLKNIL